MQNVRRQCEIIKKNFRILHVEINGSDDNFNCMCEVQCQHTLMARFQFIKVGQVQIVAMHL